MWDLMVLVPDRCLFFLLLTSYQQRGHMETGPRFKVSNAIEKGNK